MKLICLPHSGATSNIYHNWRRLLPVDLELVGIDYPGRGRRMREPLLYHFETLLDDVQAHYANHFDGPLWFFGHSLGGALSFSLARRLQNEGKDVRGLFVSGRRSPMGKNLLSDISDLDDLSFLQAIESRYGVLPKALYDPEFQSIFLPPLRADIKVNETYQLDDLSPIACPLHVMIADDDRSITPEEIKGWFQFTTMPGDVITVPGNHISCLTDADAVTMVVKEVSRRIKLSD